MGGQQEKPTVPKIAFTVQGLKSLLYAESGHFDRRDNELRSLALRVSASGAAAIIFDLFFPVLFLPLGAIARLAVAVQLPPSRGDWYVTGDRATRDEDGYLWFVGRADDVILSAGYRIGPFEVESALLEHDAVAESAVVSSPDEVRGALVKAFIVLKDGYEPSDALTAEIQEHVKAATAPYKYPRRIEFLDTLPKTVSGKIKRAQLRERERAGE
jgi:acyl-CoA synthetase (AMP-forming)/AMP-acid ligase II